MLQQVTTIGDQILEVVKANPECTLEEVIHQLREWDWLDVFVEVDRLNRKDRLRLSQSSLGLTTTLRLP